MHLLLAAGVMLMAALLGLLWLTALENGSTVAVPLPFSPSTWLFSQGTVLAGFAALGALAAAVALLAPMLWLLTERRKLRRQLRQREAHLRELLALQERGDSGRTA